MKILVGISGSFCNHARVLKVLNQLKQKHQIDIVLTHNVATMSTRYFENEDFLEECKQISPTLITTLQDAELIGPHNLYDCMLVMPCTANTLSRIATGAYDCPLALSVKAMIRNQKNVIIGLATNDALGISATNLFKLYNSKFFYFIPFSQDAPQTKPNSCVAHFELVEKVIEDALHHQQTQPLLLERPHA